MDKMEWAVESLEYLRKARIAIDDEFRGAMKDAKGYPGSWKDPWHGTSRDIISNLYHYSEEFVADVRIPNEMFASPERFEQGLVAYRAFVQAMVDDLDEEQAAYELKHKIVGAPHIVDVARRQVFHVLGAIDYTLARKPSPPAATVSSETADLDLIVTLARRFHESVLALKTHPHGGAVYAIKDEWDCQYLFRSILAAYFPDVREEEWSPSVAGSASRCEFFLKPLRAMVELKYVRKSDTTKIKKELANDFVDYGGNSEVDRLICLVYDPDNHLKNPAGFQSDLSKPRTGLIDVKVIVSPPR